MKGTRLICFVILAGCCASLTSSTSQENCEFGDNTYQIGESWHPILEPGGVDRCITCRCNAPNRVSCDKMPCPVVRCLNPVRLENSCCHVCAKNNTLRSSPSSVAPTSSKGSCRFQGRGYYDGQMFPGDQLFTGKGADQCVQCTCSGGLIYCDLRTCPAVPCSNPEVRAGSCCPVCTSDEMSLPYSNDISLPVASLEDTFVEDLANNFPGGIEANSINLDDTDRESQQNENACYSGGETYFPGEQWHPLLIPFGRTTCVICTCTIGIVTCDPVRCVADEDLPCKNPRHVTGKCCKICPGEDVDPDNSEPPLCLNEFETHLFYTYQPPVVYRPDEGHIVTYAVEDIAHSTVRIAQWEVSQGIIQNHLVEEIPSQNFERATVTEEYTQGRFQLVGATTKQRVQKLLRRESRLKRRCSEECLEHIIKLTKVLRVSEVRRSQDCSQSEDTLSRRRRSLNR